eukprot:TRINITY_DN54_c0_g1_i1.p1 TRINITY_DN54_c0_g1~~TRINITY_DN54_c0_g1_i1.p1  ORF type:complete len:136 (-),score=49.83 TRINITY_DN54_c0_g1_i1:99-506(-)
MIILETSSEAVDAYNKMKMKRAYRWIIFKIEGDKCIVVDSVGEPTSTFADFVSKIPKSEPRYAAYDLEVTHTDGRKESKILLILYAPDSSPTKSKFLYASGKESLKKKIGSVHKEFQISNHADLDEEKFTKVFVH